MVDQVVTPEAQAHGIYEIENTSVTEGEFDGQTKGTMSVVRNRASTTIERWVSRGDIDRRRAEAIAIYARCWRLWIGEQRVTANWSLVANFRGGTTGFDTFASTRIHAKRILDHLDEEVFFRVGLPAFNVFQDVVVYDRPAGAAGTMLGPKSLKQAEAVAKMVVLMLADQIATELNLGNQRPATEWLREAG